MERRDFLQLTGLAAGALMVPPYARPLVGRARPRFLPPIGSSWPTRPSRRRAAPGRQLRRRAHRPLPEPVHQRPRDQGPEHRQHRIVRRRHPRDRQRRLGLRRHQRRDARRRRQRGARRPSRSPRPTPGCRPSRCSWPRSAAYGEVAWRTPIKKNAFEVSDQGEGRPADRGEQRRAQGRRQLHLHSMLFLVNEQKYFASTDGCYIDQDMHRIWPQLSASPPSTRRAASSRPATRSRAPVGMGYEYLDARPRDKVKAAGGRDSPTATPTT